MLLDFAFVFALLLSPPGALFRFCNWCVRTFPAVLGWWNRRGDWRQSTTCTTQERYDMHMYVHSRSYQSEYVVFCPAALVVFSVAEYLWSCGRFLTSLHLSFSSVLIECCFVSLLRLRLSLAYLPSGLTRVLKSSSLTLACSILQPLPVCLWRTLLCPSGVQAVIVP